ncbi:hypothetical protein AXG93_4542s1080 [Marchantia polymorpha subsp. ruderalis]|uniref:Uncharacterized protein n=1 Tax=Marchantia polymorpha subsp. ruderalis TaxID=1480154 RepID=A0A176W0J3_MARPO|nr:hypothetical protein AXG93_4542s1080 [Marchantia polymorpha subsp. ruderalis]
MDRSDWTEQVGGKPQKWKGGGIWQASVARSAGHRARACRTKLYASAALGDKLRRFHAAVRRPVPEPSASPVDPRAGTGFLPGMSSPSVALRKGCPPSSGRRRTKRQGRRKAKGRIGPFARPGPGRGSRGSGQGRQSRAEQTDRQRSRSKARQGKAPSAIAAAAAAEEEEEEVGLGPGLRHLARLNSSALCSVRLLLVCRVAQLQLWTQAYKIGRSG